MRRKGFVFTLDATLGIFLMVLALMAIAIMSIQSEADPYATINSLRQAHDMLAVLDAQGMLAQANCSAITAYINSTVPLGTGASLEIDTYYKDVAGFAFLSTQTCGDGPPQNTSTYAVEYGFANMKNGRTTNYSIARMYTWQE